MSSNVIIFSKVPQLCSGELQGCLPDHPQQLSDDNPVTPFTFYASTPHLHKNHHEHFISQGQGSYQDTGTGPGPGAAEALAQQKPGRGQGAGNAVPF